MLNDPFEPMLLPPNQFGIRTADNRPRIEWQLLMDGDDHVEAAGPFWSEEFFYYLVLQIQTFKSDEQPEHWQREGIDIMTHYATLHVVSFSQLKRKNLLRVLDSNQGWKPGCGEPAVGKHWLAYDCALYGCAACVWQDSIEIPECDDWEPVWERLEEWAKAEALSVRVIFGIYMDQRMNMVGATGWDFVQGEMLPTSMRRVDTELA